MTYEEAIKVINNTKIMVLKGSVNDLQKASYKACKALEKQIAKPVKDFHCPACNQALTSKKKDGKFIMEYCKACGQKLDWSE